jgi:hypothetical protein
VINLVASMAGEAHDAHEQEVQIGNPCAGINRHEVENARVSRERGSDPLGPEFCAGHREVHSGA